MTLCELSQWECAPCFKVDLFQTNLYGVLIFSIYYILKFRSLSKNVYIIVFVLLRRILSCYNLS